MRAAISTFLVSAFALAALAAPVEKRNFKRDETNGGIVETAVDNAESVNGEWSLFLGDVYEKKVESMHRRGEEEETEKNDRQSFFQRGVTVFSYSNRVQQSWCSYINCFDSGTLAYCNMRS